MSEVEPAVASLLRVKDAKIATLMSEMAQLTNMDATEYRGILVRAEQGEHLADNLRTYLRSLGTHAPTELVNALLVYDRYLTQAEGED